MMVSVIGLCNDDVSEAHHGGLIQRQAFPDHGSTLMTSIIRPSPAVKPRARHTTDMPRYCHAVTDFIPLTPFPGIPRPGERWRLPQRPVLVGRWSNLGIAATSSAPA